MSAVQSTGTDPARRPLPRWWTVLGVLVVATALRPLVVTVGPVLPDLQADLGLGAVPAALLTALPVACFGLGAFAGPALARRIGLDSGLTAALALMVLGATVRVLGGPELLFSGTIVVGAAIAVANVLLPALVRRDFPRRVGLVTGLYTSTLSVTATLAALLAVPLADRSGAGWRGPFTFWAAAAAIALLAWLGHRRTVTVLDPLTTQPPSGALGLLRNSTARGLTVFMGLQSIGFYTLAAWLPSLLQDNGLSPAASGALLSVATVIGIPAGLLLPLLAGRMRRQSGLTVVTSVVTAAGWAGLLLAPGAAVLWVILLGIGTGSSFPLALVLIGLRSRDASVTPQLSAVVQGVGYLIAATGPLLVGVLHDVTGGWALPLYALLALTVGQGITGWSAGRDRLI
jgi:CP family cyanate transporter-like MFS transporter